MNKEETEASIINLTVVLTEKAIRFAQTNQTDPFQFAISLAALEMEFIQQNGLSEEYQRFVEELENAD